jgi:hypothetical protein
LSQWIVSSIPSWLILAALVVVIAAAAVAIVVYVRRRYPILCEGGHNDVAKVAFSVIGPVYGFMTGFIIVVLWGQVNAADQVVRTEAASAVQLVRDVNVFDKADSDRIRQSLLDYERAAVAEWPQAARGHATPEAETALKGLYTTYEGIQARDEKQRSFLTNSLASLKQLSTSRSERLLMARTNTGPPWTFWAVILLTSGLVLGFAVIFGEARADMHYTMIVAVSALVAVLLFLITELAHPFLGEIGTSPEPMRAVIQVAESR